jgi:hypothetical protein
MKRKDWMIVLIDAGIALFIGFKSELAAFAADWNELTVWRFLFFCSVAVLAGWGIDFYVRMRILSRVDALSARLDEAIGSYHAADDALRERIRAIEARVGRGA